MYNVTPHFEAETWFLKMDGMSLIVHGDLGLKVKVMKREYF